LLREIDPEFKTPASNNLIFQTLPAIIFGFPMMFLAGYCNQSDKATYITLGICVIFFVFMNLILFRNQIFRRKTNK
jgi:ESS family glutamate:Na+ symporter